MLKSAIRRVIEEYAPVVDFKTLPPEVLDLVADIAPEGGRVTPVWIPPPGVPGMIPCDFLCKTCGHRGCMHESLDRNAVPRYDIVDGVVDGNPDNFSTFCNEPFCDCEQFVEIGDPRDDLPGDVRREEVVVIGSTKFREDMVRWAWKETKKHRIVHLPPFSKEEINDVEAHRSELFAQQKQKIDKADTVFVFDPRGYIGKDTRMEIDYATSIRKKVEYLEKPARRGDA